MSLSINIGRPFLNDKTLDEQARSILRLYGTDAHVYLPGANGVAVSGLPTNNYTLSDGSTGYSAVDGTAGLVLDAAGSVGVELFTGAFTRNNTVESDTTTVPAVCTSTGVFSVVGINKSATANTPYLCSLTWSGNTTGRTIQFGGGSAIVVLGTAVSGSATFTVAPSIGNMYIYFTATAAGQSVSFDSFSARPISGIHATQSTTANKPALRRGLYNLLTYSNDYTNAAWAKTAIPAPTTGIADPWGGNTAQKIVATAVATNHYLSPSSGSLAPANTTCTYAVIASASGESVLGFGVAGGTTFSASFNLLTGVATANGTTAEMKSLGAGWYLCVMVATPTAYGHSPYVTIRATQTNFTGDGVSGLNLAGVGLFYGVLSAQQILSEGGIPLTTSTAASNSGAGRYSWQFDGTNDSLALGSVPFQMSDDFLIVGAVRFGNPTSWSTVFSVSGATTTPRIQLFCDNANGFVKAYLRDDAGVNVNPGGTVDVRGTSVVATLWKVGTNVYLRVNGVQVATTSVSTFGAMTLTGASIGRLFNGTDYMSGDIGQVISVKGTFTENDVLTIERLCAANTPSGPSF